MPWCYQMKLKSSFTKGSAFFLFLFVLLTLVPYFLLFYFTSSNLYLYEYITSYSNDIQSWRISQFGLSDHNKQLFHWIPQNDDSLLLQNLSTNFNSCQNDGTKTDHFMVILVLNRITSSQQRFTIRSTYANSTIMNKLRNQMKPKHKWALFFIVGRPDNEKQQLKIFQENIQFQDIIVVNASEGYFYSTVKMLIGIKVVAKFCSHAKYVVKTDDDVYLRLAKLEEVIVKVQQLSNNEAIKYKSHDVPLYSGVLCENYTTLRSGRWAVGRGEYPYPKYPFYCAGVLNIFSQHTIQRMAKECPNHCIGEGTFFPRQSYSQLTPSNRSKQLAEKCFYRFEDTFLGSCVNSFRNPPVTITPIQPQLGMYFKYFNDAKSSKNVSTHIGVHTNANDGMVDTEMNRHQKNRKRDLKNEMQVAHEFYTNMLQ